MRIGVLIWLLAVPLIVAQASCSMAGAKSDSKRLILTFTVTVPYHMPEAMTRMASVVHAEGVPINWQISLDSAVKVKSLLEDYHRKHGDELIALGIDQDYQQWRQHFPWSELNIAGSRVPTGDEFKHRVDAGVVGSWGYCYQQVGIDEITHWGCPWGLFHISPKNPLIPARDAGKLVGIPWTVRDLHKAYHTRQPINFCIDPIEMVRSGTLCWGENITYFRDLLDELIRNTGWNERVYCCLHEEANGPFIAEGKGESDEGATPEQSEAMYQMITEWLRYAKGQRVTIMTLPEAVADYQKISNKETLPSTLLTRDKHRGRIRYYVPPFPPGTTRGEMGPAGNYPNTLFHCDQDCQMAFVHPEILPRYVLDYRAQHAYEPNRPYPEEPVLPTVVDWICQRDGKTRVFAYQLQFWSDMPFGVTEWGDFRGWEIQETNGLYAKIIDDCVLFLRMDLANVEKTPREVRHRGIVGRNYWVRLRRKSR